MLINWWIVSRHFQLFCYSVAERIVDLGSITLSKRRLSVVRLPVEHPSVDDVIQPTEVSPKVKLSKVLVSGVKQKLTKSILTMYFENTKRSGGGPISKLTMLEEEEKAVIDFVDAEGTFPCYYSNSLFCE